MKHLAIQILGLACLWVWATSSAAQDGSYQIAPGDTLRVEVLEDSSLDRNVLVTPDGRISVPLAGTVQAGGRTVTQVERAVSSALARNFANPPTVFVSVTGIPMAEDDLLGEDGETILVYILGEVNDPGPKTMLPGTTVLQALSQAGGFTAFAATKRLQLRRTDPRTGRQQLTLINYQAISRGAQVRREPTVIEGDVLLVPERRLFE